MSIRLEWADGAVVYIESLTDVLADASGDSDVGFWTYHGMEDYDLETIDAVVKAKDTIAVNEAVVTSSPGYDTIQLGLDGATTPEAIEVQSVPAYMGQAGEHDDEKDNPFHAEGEVIGQLLSLDETRVLLYSDIVSPIMTPRRRCVEPADWGYLRMNLHEIVLFVRSVGPQLLLPVHCDTFEPIETLSRRLQTS